MRRLEAVDLGDRAAHDHAHGVGHVVAFKRIGDILVLYLGKMVEMTDSDTLFDKPLHPYTKALLTAIPVPDASYKGKEAEVMKGEVTSPIEPPPGCRFAARCPMASDKCFKESPEFKEVEPNHFVACHLYE